MLNSTLDGKPQPIRDAKEQSAEDKALVAFVRNKLDERRQSSARVAQEGINLTNTAYLCGFDGIFFDGTSRTFKPIPTPSQFLRKNRVHVNRILPTVQNRLARLLNNEPRWDVKPKSSDEEDKDGARLAEQILVQLWDSLGTNKKRIPMTMRLQQEGSAYFKVSWDPTLGSKKVNPKPKLNEAGEETGETEYEVIAEGDMRVDVCSFFEIFPDDKAKSWDELQDLIQAKIRPIDYFPSQYGDIGKLVKPEDCWLNSLTYDARINQLNSVTGSAGASASQMKDSAIEISYYEKPSSKHPYGRHLIVANGVKLKDDILPIDEIPFVKFDDIVVGGKFNGEAVITHLRPLQDQINQGKTLRAAWMNRTLMAKFLAARGHNIAAEAWNDQSGEVIMYDPVPNSQEPHELVAPSIPSYAFEEEKTLKDDMNDTAGINEASRGQLPSSSIPAIGMQLLVEQDDTRIGIETEAHEYSYADLGRIKLKFVDKYYKTDRLLKFVGENQEYAVRTYRGSDVRENFDVHVIRGSTLPGSKVLKRQEIINMHQQGFFGNPQDPMVVQNTLSMLEMGDEFQAWKRHSLRMAQIQRGIQQIETEGTKPAVSEFDDHPLWMQELNDYRIGEKYLKLPPESQQFVLELINEHADWIKELSGMGGPSPEMDPSLKETDAAQQAEAEAKQQVMDSGSQAPQPLPGSEPMHEPQITPPPGAEMPAGPQ